MLYEVLFTTKEEGVRMGFTEETCTLNWMIPIRKKLAKR